MMSPPLTLHIDDVLCRSFSHAHPDGILPLCFPAPQDLQAQPPAKRRGRRSRSPASSCPPLPFAGLQKKQSHSVRVRGDIPCKHRAHSHLQTHHHFSTLVSWLTPVYRRMGSSFQKMKEGSVFSGLMASEGEKTQPAERSLSVGVSCAGLGGGAGGC